MPKNNKILPLITINKDVPNEIIENYLEKWLDNEAIIICNLCTDFTSQKLIDKIDKIMSDIGFTNEQRKNTIYVELIEKDLDIKSILHIILYDYVFKRPSIKEKEFTHLLWFSFDTDPIKIDELRKYEDDKYVQTLITCENEDNDNFTCLLSNLIVLFNKYIANLKKQSELQNV